MGKRIMALLDTINSASDRYAALFEDGMLLPEVDMQDVTAAAADMYAVLERLAAFLEKD
jgi:hypothetical protein